MGQGEEVVSHQQDGSGKDVKIPPLGQGCRAGHSPRVPKREQTGSPSMTETLNFQPRLQRDKESWLGRGDVRLSPFQLRLRPLWRSPRRLPPPPASTCRAWRPSTSASPPRRSPSASLESSCL